MRPETSNHALQRRLDSPFGSFIRRDHFPKGWSDAVIYQPSLNHALPHTRLSRARCFPQTCHAAAAPELRVAEREVVRRLFLTDL